MSKILNKNKSTYFEFEKIANLELTDFAKYTGWNNLIIVKINLKKDKILAHDFINSEISETYNKEKILVVVKGALKFSFKKKEYFLKEFDVVNFFVGEYEIESQENTEAYLISAKDLTDQDKDSIFFNFKNDIKPVDLWGGQCISRIYAGENLNLVLFDLKPGFQFNDKGHSNEQITWVVEGEMDFYANKLKKKLNISNAVDIGRNHEHGGISNGALGFDSFYPKREEEKYKKNI
jgi:quercetin dioxygenase-like cupin family protein